MSRGINLEAISIWVNKYFGFIKSKAKTILFIGFIGLILGVYYSVSYKPYYVSHLSFIINDGKSGNVSALSAIAGQLGIGSSGPTVTDDRIMFLLSAKKILGTVLLKKMDDKSGTIGDKMIEAYKLNGVLASDTLMNNFKGFTATSFDKINKQESFAIDQIINSIKLSNRFKVESVKRKANSLYGNQSNGIISITYESRNEDLAKKFVSGVYLELSEFYSESMLRNLQNNYELLNFRADSISALLRTTENESAIASDNSYNVFRYRGKVDELRLRKEVEMLNILYVEILKNREFAKFSLDQERPLFQVVDEPILPLEKKTKSIPVFSFLGFMAFILLGVFIITITFLSKKENRVI
jgi:uncharacterized protein involved in exopolysaccharide biosynthesis